MEMEMMNESSGPEEFLEKAKKIFEEREKEFQIRDHAFQKRDLELKEMLQQVIQHKNEIEQRTETLDELQDTLNREKEAIQKDQEILKQKQKELQDRVLSVDGRERKLVMQYNLELEKVRTEEMKLERLVKDYQYKLSLLDNGIGPEQTEVDLTKYITQSEHETVVSKLKKEIEDMKQERSQMLKSILELNVQLDQCKKEDICSEESDSFRKGEHTEEEAPIANDPSDVEETGTEELTAEVLKKYLIKNETKFQNIEVLHSDHGDQLRAISGKLGYRFLFTKPAEFHIVAARKNDSHLRTVLKKLNNQYPGVQFQYDEQEGEVYATGYFTDEIKPYELMQKVNEISNSCFHQD